MDHFILTAFGSFFSLCGLLLGLKALVDLGRACRSVSWPTAPGVITRSAIKTTIAPAGSPDGGHIRIRHFAPDVEFSYSVEGKNYTSRSIRAGMDVFWTNEFARSFTSRYLLDQPINVFYDPAKPSLAVLETGRHRWNFYAIGMGLCCFLVGSVALYAAWFKH